jgi:hypothetical protein
VVILCETGSHLKEKINKGGGAGGWGVQIVVPRPSASASLTGRRQKEGKRQKHKIFCFYLLTARLYLLCSFEERFLEVSHYQHVSLTSCLLTPKLFSTGN